MLGTAPQVWDAEVLESMNQRHKDDSDSDVRKAAENALEAHKRFYSSTVVS